MAILQEVSSSLMSFMSKHSWWLQYSFTSFHLWYTRASIAILYACASSMSCIICHPCTMFHAYTVHLSSQSYYIFLTTPWLVLRGKNGNREEKHHGIMRDELFSLEAPTVSSIPASNYPLKNFPSSNLRLHIWLTSLLAPRIGYNVDWANWYT